MITIPVTDTKGEPLGHLILTEEMAENIVKYPEGFHVGFAVERFKKKLVGVTISPFPSVRKE